MVKIIVFALVAGVLVAGAHAQTAVKVGDIANVNVGANGQTSVVAPGTDVKVEPKKDVKVDAGTSTTASTTVKGPAPDAKKNGNVSVDVNVGGAVKVDVKKAPEKSTTGTAAAAASTTAKPDMPAKTPEKNTAAAKPAPAKPAPAKPGAVAVSVDTKKAGETTTVKVDKAANVQVDVKAGSAGTSGTSSTTTVTAPAKTAVATSSSGNTQVNTPGADVKVMNPPGGGQPTTKVNTIAGVDVQNSPAGTTVTGIPYVGSVAAPGGRKMLRAW